jgi:hypothetical protein
MIWVGLVARTVEVTNICFKIFTALIIQNAGLLERDSTVNVWEQYSSSIFRVEVCRVWMTLQTAVFLPTRGCESWRIYSLEPAHMTEQFPHISTMKMVGILQQKYTVSQPRRAVPEVKKCIQIYGWKNRNEWNILENTKWNETMIFKLYLQETKNQCVDQIMKALLNEVMNHLSS